MACFSLSRLFRRKPTHAPAAIVPAPGPRPYDEKRASTMGGGVDYDDDYDDKKSSSRRRSARAPVPRGVAVRPTVHPSYSAYATPAPAPVSDDWLASSAAAATAAADARDERLVKKLEAEGDVSEAELRRRREEQARRKAEQEEQERLDFFQMM